MLVISALGRQRAVPGQPGLYSDNLSQTPKKKLYKK
jgi:hypothetical protein